MKFQHYSLYIVVLKQVFKYIFFLISVIYLYRLTNPKPRLNNVFKFVYSIIIIIYTQFVELTQF